MAKVTKSELLALIARAEAEQWTELDLRGLYLEELPPEIGRLQQLEVLKLGYDREARRYNYLENLPDTLGQLTNLQSLDLSWNNLSEVPAFVGQLTNLQSLALSGNNLSEVPAFVGQLTNLQSLDLSGNNLSEVPAFVGQLTNLQSLDLSQNNLSEVPAFVGQLTNLQSLALSGNNLSEVPAFVGQLTNLQSLALSYNKLSEVPAFVGQLTNLQSLDLSQNNLSEVPAFVGQLTNLQSLDLSGNKLSEVPAFVGQLTNLQSLDLSQNNLSEVPAFVGQLTNLQSLDLSGNNLSEVPAFVGQLTNLQSLDLSYNKLSEVPAFVGQLTNLQSLDLSYNKLSEVPAFVGQLTNLQSLALSYNKLSEVPAFVGQLTNLQSLALSGNNLSEVPAFVGQLTNLQSLDLSYNKLSEVPAFVGQLTNLQSLDLSYNKLSEVPAFVGQLTNLQSLDLSYNKLSEVPAFVGQLTNLQGLALSYINLSEVPAFVGQLTNLQSLALSGNNLSEVPAFVGQLTNLQSLDLSQNNLSEVPAFVGQLTNLQSLDLSYNKLSEVPAFVGQLTNLSSLYIADNPIINPSPEVLGEALTERFKSVDLERLRQYYAQLQAAGTATFYEAKLLIIGEGGAGKTSLAAKLQAPGQPLPLKLDSTEGIDILSWQFPLPPDGPEETYHVNIWDFGGQAVYFATHQFFLTRRSVYVLVADTRRQHTDFYTWLRMQETFGGRSPIILLKNRNRRHGNRFYIENLPQLRERFPNLKEVVELDLDAVPDDGQWPQLLRELQHRFLSLDHVGKPRPRTWVDVREALQTDARDTISQAEYLAICAKHGIERRENALQLSDYLHNLGDLLHFQDDPLLAELVILQPTWGLDAVYRVLDNPAIVENWGRFTLSDLHALWHEPKYASHHHQLLRLMQKFQLCYPLPNQADTYIAPQLLQPEVPDYEWDQQDNLQLRYRYPIFMPRGILSRAIVRLHPRIEEQRLVWRAGVVLNDGYARAELLELRGENEIRVRVAGRNQRDLLMEIVRALDDLHRGFPQLRYEKLIPCRCATCARQTEPHFFDLKELLDRIGNRKDTIECKKPPYENVAIRNLLEDAGWQRPHKPDGPFDKEAMYTVYGDFYAGDHLAVGDVTNSSGVAVGGQSQTAVTQTIIEEDSVSKKTQQPVKSAWANGLFYLFVFVVIIAALGFLANSVPFMTLIAILIAGVLFILLVGALQLRQDENLSQKNFLELMRMVLAQLPLIGRFIPNGESESTE